MSNKDRIVTKAIVRVTLEVTTTQSWDSTSWLSEVWRVGKEEALEKIKAMIRDKPNIRVVGELKAVSVSNELAE